jgi:hypothetical protein
MEATMKATDTDDSRNFLGLVRGKERYIFVYDDGQEADILRVLGRQAVNPELSFNWYDAARLARKVQKHESMASDSGPDDISTFDAWTAVLGPQERFKYPG